MQIVPLLHIKDGVPLVGRPGAWTPAPTPYPDGGDDLAGLARHLSVRFGSVCVVDLGTGRTSEPHLNLYQKLVKQNVAVWVDAFPANLEDVMDLFVAGADRVTIRLDDFDDSDLEEVLLMAEGEVWLGLPFRTLDELDRLIRKKAPHQYLRSGASGVVLIDLTAAGTGHGADPQVLARAPRETAAFVAGGVGTTDHAAQWKEAGAAGIFVGSALFEDLDGWARYAQGEQGPPPPRVVGTTRDDVTIEQRPGLLPGVLPGPPARPRRDEEP